MSSLKPGLYIVSTPIGNLLDITIRAIETLKNSDIIFCEDTRISKKLLVKHNITAKLHVYNDHSDSRVRSNICELIEQGMIVSLISDAGTPLISDPGYRLIKELAQNGYHVDAIPGVSSPILALTLSQLPTDRFLFAGFLPKTTFKRRKTFEEFITTNATLIFFDTANRLLDSLQVARAVYGNREICIARELTKLYQETKVGCIDEVIKYYTQHPLKGEIILLISSNIVQDDEQTSNDDLIKFIKEGFSNSLTSKTITQNALKIYNDLFSKKAIYKIVNDLKSRD